MMGTARNRSLRHVLLLGPLAVVSVICFGQESGKTPPSPPDGQYQAKLRDVDFIRAGSAIFVPNCSSTYCHGAGGMGGGAPRLRGRDLDPSYVFKTVSNGIGGSAMIGFKSELTDEQRWKLVAFILSPVEAKEPSRERPAESGSLKPGTSGGVSTPPGDAAIGRELFYDLGNQRSCHGCHAIKGVGGKVGPDLGGAGAAKSDAELLSAILTPHTVTNSNYLTVTLSLADGDKIVGVKKEEGKDVVRVYDITVLPAVLRTVPKTEIVKTETSEKSIMPSDYASIYTEKQLADIVAFIKSTAVDTPRR